MKRTLFLSLVLIFAGVASASWVETFDEYYDGNASGTLPSPWTDNNNNACWIDGVGYGGSVGAGSLTSSPASAFRATDEGTLVLTSQLYSGDSSSGSQVGFSTAKSITPGGWLYYQSVSMFAYGTTGTLYFRIYNSTGSARTSTVAISTDTWYDARITLTPNGDNWDALAEYKLASSDTWIELHEYAYAPGYEYDPNYVGIVASGTAVVDNVSAVPEPATLALLSAGGMLAVARKRRH